MGNSIDPQKILSNLESLLKKADPKQLRLLYMVAYEIVKK